MSFLFLLGSLAGIVFILYRKIPVLLVLQPEEQEVKDLAKQGSEKFAIVQKINPEKMLGSALLKAQGLASKTEAQTTKWLEKLRQKSEQHKAEFRESYWDRLHKKKKS